MTASHFIRPISRLSILRKVRGPACVMLSAALLFGCTTVHQRKAVANPDGSSTQPLQGAGYSTAMPGATSAAVGEVAKTAQTAGQSQSGTIGTGPGAGQPAVSANQYASGDQAYWSSDSTANAAPSDLSQSSIMASGLKDWTTAPQDSARLKQIEMAAATLGSQVGLHARAQQIQDALIARATSYDKSFNFSAVMLEPGFLPPVITEARDTYRQEDDNSARASDMVFKIERPARIVSAVPSWRVYLLADAPPAARPDSALLPKSADEKKVWDAWAAKGWAAGVHLANENFEANLSRLRRDFNGMLRFKMLYNQGLVSKPILARSTLGTTGGGDEMAINDRIIRITAKAALDANGKNWSGKEPRTALSDPPSP